jgi:hypothetical protein
MVVIFDAPIDGIAGEAIPAGQRGDVPNFDAAQSALRGSPERPARIDAEVMHGASAQPFGSRIRGLNLALPDVGNPSLNKAEP